MGTPRRAWRRLMKVAIGVCLAAVLAALIGRWLNFGVFTRGYGFLCWTDGRVVVGVTDPARVGPRVPGPVILERRPIRRVHQSARDWPEMGSLIWVVLTARWFVDIPVWGLPLPPLFLCVLAYGMSRPKPGRCAECGYSLAGLMVASGGAVVCPECGKAGAKGTG